MRLWTGFIHTKLVSHSHLVLATFNKLNGLWFDKFMQHACLFHTVRRASFMSFLSRQETERVYHKKRLCLQSGLFTRYPLLFALIEPGSTMYMNVVHVYAAGGISRTYAFVLVAKPWMRVAKPWEDWRRVKLTSLHSLVKLGREYGSSTTHALTNPTSYAG